MSGKRSPTSIPNFKLICSGDRLNISAREMIRGCLSAMSVTTPISCGATEAPRSPPAAIIANRKTPPEGMRSVDTMRLPGQSIDTQSPVIAQARSATIGLLLMATVR